jgi:hypothetical protein
MATRVWVLGADDPEMAAIERLLLRSKERMEYAIDDFGKRVTPASAYKVEKISQDALGSQRIYFVECGLAAENVGVKIDHHRPGDPGYGARSVDFMKAASIGQTISELARLGSLKLEVTDCSFRTMLKSEMKPGDIFWNSGWYVCIGDVSDKTIAIHIPKKYMFIAAADHCLGEAYADQCLGVDRNSLFEFRLKQKVLFQSEIEESEIDYLELQNLMELLRIKVDRAYNLLANAKIIEKFYKKTSIPENQQRRICDIRGPEVPELPEAATLYGLCYLASPAPRTGERQKIVIGGYTTPAIVETFMAVWGPRNGLVEIYGDPTRGFAGGFLGKKPTNPAL